MEYEYIIVCLAALIGSGLTFFSGFGLGTILVPVFALFFPLEVALVLTAIVHFLNGGFKLLLVGIHANKNVILRFGIPAIIFSFLGASLLKVLSDNSFPLFYYRIQGHLIKIYPLGFIIGLLLILFALFELIPRLNKLQLSQKYLPLGGILSGFFGGLSGNQGALRSVFLLRAGLTKESFIATGVVIACMIDITRLTVYIPKVLRHRDELDFTLIACATIAAFIGAYVGNKLLKKVTIVVLRYVVSIALMLFGCLLMLGIL